LGAFAYMHSGKDMTIEEEVIILETYDAVLLFVGGDVKIRDGNATEWVDATSGITLNAGDNLKTGDDSWAEVGFGVDFKNALKIKEKTRLDFIEVGPVSVDLLKGEIRSLVEHLDEESSFEIKTPTAICGARGTGWDTWTDGIQVAVNAYENEVYFHSMTQEGIITDYKVVKAGQSCILKDPDSPAEIEELKEEKCEEWCDWKDDFGERRESVKHDIVEGRYKITKRTATKVGVLKQDNGDWQLMILPPEEDDSTEEDE